METFIADRDLDVEIQYSDSEGTAITPVSASYSLIDEMGTAILDGVVLAPSAPTETITVLGVNNALLPSAVRGYRELTVTYVDDQGKVRDFNKTWLIESRTTLSPGLTSFATNGSMILTAVGLAEVEEFLNAPVKEQMVSLHQAYRNIAQLPVLITINEKVYTSTAELDAPTLASLGRLNLDTLKTAQVIEANFLLGGNPMEQRRRDGILSESIGEVSQFFRTSKPLVMPVCREAARVLGKFMAPSAKTLRRG